MATPIAITSFYMNGSIDGPRFIQTGFSKLKLFVIPRKHLDVISKYKELDAPCFYILTGVNNDEPTAYIGHAKSFKNRIITHNQQKEFWKTAFAFASNDSVSLTSTDVQYFEFMAIEDAKKGNMKIVLDNKNKPHKPAIDEAREATMLRVYDEIKMLAEFAGCNVFNRTESTDDILDSNDLFFAKSKGVTAKGLYNPSTKEFVVLKGSEIVLETVDSYKNKEQREIKIKESTTKKDGKLILTADMKFTSPSGASSFVLGRPSNGWEDWKDNENKSLTQRFS